MALREGEETRDDSMKKCFCGTEAILQSHPVGYGDKSSRVYNVACAKTGCWEGPREKSRFNAITAWNNRSDE